MKNTSWQNKTILYSKCSVIFLILFILPRSGFYSDLKCFSNWATYSSQHGIGNIYDSDSDYLPLYQYILFLFGKFIHIPEKIELYNYNLKLITFPFISYLVILFSDWFVITTQILKPHYTGLCFISSILSFSTIHLSGDNRWYTHMFRIRFFYFAYIKNISLFVSYFVCT